MTLFLIIIGAISLVTLGIILFPLLRRRPTEPVHGRSEYDLVVYQDQLKEVDRDVDRRLLSQDQAAALRIEIKRRMLAAAPHGVGSSSSAVPLTPRPRVLIAAIAVLVPLSAFSLYFYLGVPGLPSVPFAERIAPKTPVVSDRDRKLLDELASKMEKNPTNVGGWMLLGRSYFSLGLHTEAVKAYRRAMEFAPNRADIGAYYGEALVLAANSIVTAKAERVFSKVLKLAPRNFRARYYLALAKAQRGEVASAVQDWVDLLSLAPADAPWPASVKKVAVAAAKGVGLDVSKMKPSAAAVELAKGGADASAAVKRLLIKKPSQADVATINAMPKKQREAVILSMVERLAAQMKKDPYNVGGWRQLAQAYKVLGKTEKAKWAIKRAESAAKAGKGKAGKFNALGSGAVQIK